MIAEAITSFISIRNHHADMSAQIRMEIYFQGKSSSFFNVDVLLTTGSLPPSGFGRIALTYFFPKTATKGLLNGTFFSGGFPFGGRAGAGFRRSRSAGGSCSFFLGAGEFTDGPPAASGCFFRESEIRFLSRSTARTVTSTAWRTFRTSPGSFTNRSAI